jgi:hypothetical protein
MKISSNGHGDPYIPLQTLFDGGIMIRTSYKMGYITWIFSVAADILIFLD